MMETDVLNSKSKFLTEQALSFLVLNALLAALLLLLFVYPFLMGNTLYYRDISHNYYPILQFMKESLQQGQLPFWNPFLFWGTPQVATLEPPLFYPFAWFFFIFDFGPALIINLCVHYVLAAWGMYFFLKSYCLQPWAQVYAAVAWAFGGVLISLYHMHPLLNTVVWIPWLFLCARQYILAESHNKSLRLMWGLSFSLVLALQTLSGHLEIVYFTSLSGLVYVLSLCSNKVNLRSVTQLVFFFCLGMGMAAVQLMPSLAFMPESLRGTGIEVEEAQYFSLHPFHLPGAFVPRFLGDLLSLFNLRPMVGDAELSYNSLLNSVYLGVSTVILACLSGFKKRKETYFWFGLALISLLGALGKYFYFYTLAWSYLPGFGLFRYPEKLFIFTGFALCVLAAFGLDFVYHSSWLKIRVALFSVFSTGFLVLMGAYVGSLAVLRFLIRYFALDYTFIQDMSVWATMNANALRYSILVAFLFLLTVFFLLYLLKTEKIKVQTASLVLLTLVSGDLLYNAKSQIWFVDKSFYELEPATATFLDQHLSSQYAYLVENNELIPNYFLPMYKDQPLFRYEVFGLSHLKDNFGILYDLRSAYGFLPLRTWRSNMFFTAYQAKKIKNTAFEDTYFSLLSVKYRILVTPTPAELELVKSNGSYRQLEHFLDTDSYVFENKGVIPRARFQYQSIVVNRPEDAFQIWSDPEAVNYTPQNRVILVNSAALKQAQQQVPSQEAQLKQWSTPQFENESAQTFDVRLENNTSGYLVLSDQYMPGWKAYDNGTPTPILQANFLQRAVRVGPGKHTIRFVYEPPGFALGWKVSLFSFGLALLLLGWGVRSWKRVQDPLKI